MSTYRELVGKKIKKVSSDPSSGTEGEMWYNSTTGTLRGPAITSAWSSGANQTTFREGSTAVMGTTTAGLIAGGSSPSAPYTNKTEEYNGLGWAAGGDLNTGRSAYGGAGTQTAGLTAGGYTGTNIALSEEYNGTAWTEGENLNTARRAYSVSGTQTAGLLAGGYTTTGVTDVEEYDGTDWTTVTAMPTAIISGGMAGIQTSSIQIAGTPPGSTSFAYDGTNWTAGPSLTTARSQGGYAGTTQNAAMAISGETPPGPKTVNCEEYDGTSWSEIANVSTAGNPSGNSPGGSVSSAFLSSGQSRPLATEEYNKSTNTIIAAAWASGGAMPAAYYGFSGSAGTLTAGIALGGKTPPGDQATILKYDGTSWTANPSNLNTARRSGASVGTQTATLLAGGVTGSTTFKNEAEEFNGSSAAAQTALPYSGSSNFGFGTQTAAVIAGGYAPPFPTLASTNVEYDGSSWTAATALPAARGLGGSAGQAQTTGLVWAGLSPSAVDTTLEYDELIGLQVELT